MFSKMWCKMQRKVQIQIKLSQWFPCVITSVLFYSVILNVVAIEAPMVLISCPLSSTDCFPSAHFSSHPLFGNFTQYQVSLYYISWFLCQLHSAQTSLFYVKEMVTTPRTNHTLKNLLVSFVWNISLPDLFMIFTNICKGKA